MTVGKSPSLSHNEGHVHSLQHTGKSSSGPSSPPSLSEDDYFQDYQDYRDLDLQSERYPSSDDSISEVDEMFGELKDFDPAMGEEGLPDESARKDFENEIKDAKESYKNSVQAESRLSGGFADGLIKGFNDKVDALLNRPVTEKAREELESIINEMQGQIEVVADSVAKEKAKEQKALYDTLSQFTDQPKFKEQNGHWWNVGVSLGEKFLSALQIDKTEHNPAHWNDFRKALGELKENQRWVCVMRVVTAIYRTAGKNDEKAFQMLSTFVPKDVIQSMRDQVTSEPQNQNWVRNGNFFDNPVGGNAGGNEVGPEGYCEWTPKGTADFLRRSLDARKDPDPYQEDQLSGD